MKIIEVNDISAPELAPFAALTDARLRNRLHPEQALLIAESPKVIRVALAAGMVPVSMLCEARHITGDAADIVARLSQDMPLYTAPRKVLEALTGYTLTRGVLCAMRRPQERTVTEVCRDARRVAVLDGVCDTTNIGNIFRSAAALGLDAVLLTPTTCDPLNRRALRVSMGTVFKVPWTRVSADMHELRELGFKTAALALTDRSLPIDDPAPASEPRLAMVLGTEGDGLSPEVITECDYTLRIPMSRGVDSLNVGAAAAIAFYLLTR